MLRRLLLGLLALLIIAGAAGGWRFHAARQRWREVVSIERDPAYQDPALLERAFAEPVAGAFRSAGLDAQANPSFCGPTTVVDVLRSLGTPAAQSNVLEGSGVHTVFGWVAGGMTLDEVAALLRVKTRRPVTVHRGEDLAAFRALIAGANDPAKRVTVNFDRGPLFGRGGGHHSPVGAYLPDRDLALVLDVNGGYRPWLVSVPRLKAAVDTVDPATGQSRGLLVVE